MLPMPLSRHLYETAGFRVWGTEPRALQSNGRFLTEHHMALALGSSE